MGERAVGTMAHDPRTHIQELVDKWQARLNMEHWRIAVVLKEDVEHHGRKVFMAMRRSEFYDRGTLEISACALEARLLPDCIEKDLYETSAVTHEEFLEESIVHELLHLQFRDLMETGDLIREQLAPHVADVWDGAWRRAEEATVERMAIALRGNWGS